MGSRPKIMLARKQNEDTFPNSDHVAPGNMDCLKHANENEIIGK